MKIRKEEKKEKFHKFVKEKNSHMKLSLAN